MGSCYCLPRQPSSCLILGDSSENLLPGTPETRIVAPVCSAPLHAAPAAPAERLSEPVETSPYLYGAGRRLAAEVFSSSAKFAVGQQLPINPTQPTRVENDEISGHILFLHRPEPEPEEGWAYSDHFRPKKRRFELRLQGRFKTQAEQIFFGGELAAPIELSWTTRAMASAGTKVVNSLSAARGVWLHCTPQELSHAGPHGTHDVEVQHIVWPLFAADTLIVTPAGETPPLLTEPFANTPLAEKRAIRFNTADTFTFVYYTQYIDYLTWSVRNMPVGSMNRGFADFLGNSPINLVAYRLHDPGGEHTQLNKRYLARLVFANSADAREDNQWQLGSDAEAFPSIGEARSDIKAQKTEDQNVSYGSLQSPAKAGSRDVPCRPTNRSWLSCLCWCCP